MNMREYEPSLNVVNGTLSRGLCNRNSLAIIAELWEWDSLDIDFGTDRLEIIWDLC